jgi:hypothetical protein
MIGLRLERLFYLGLAEKRRKAERVSRSRGEKGIMVQRISVK